MYRLGLILFGLMSLSAQAQTVVLVHGMAAKADTWLKHQVAEPLYATGFRDATHLLSRSSSSLPSFKGSEVPNKVFYRVSLPWYAPLATQARILREQVALIYQQRQEPIILVGHSVGGVVARLYLLSPQHVPIEGLITIASPHLGTPWATMVWQMLQSPMGALMDLMGTYPWHQAQQLLWELSPSVRNTVLQWMNWQPHPAGVRYISVVHRPNWPAMKQDIFVPIASQNMNNVPALRGRSEVYPLPANHHLTQKDGVVLAMLLGTFPISGAFDVPQNAKRPWHD